MTLLGNLGLWLALLVGIWGALAGFVGGLRNRPDPARSARRAVLAMCAALLVAVVSLEWALFQHDFNVEYVAAYTSRNLPVFYTWSALYAGQKGSLLFWATVLSVFGSLALVLTPRHHRALLPYVAGVVSLVAAFFISVMLFGQANPFQRLPYTPLDGNGLNPQLQNPGMVFHPPMLYLGYISITIPFAFAIAALLSRRLDTDWLVAIRKWTLLSWLFLSIGICLGMWWAYVELGWGGYWAWDLVENASLLPWLTMTAFLHSVMIQEMRGMLKKWNLALIIGSWLLSIFGTFITRSGVISSVHSFTQSNAGCFFLFLLLVAGMRDGYALVAIGLGGFVAATIAQEFARGTSARHRQYGEPYLLAVGRLIARNRRRYGGYVVHTGIVMLFVAFSGMAFKTETEATLRPGESVSLRSPYGPTYTLTHLGISQYDALNRLATAAAVEVRRDGKRIGMLNPEKRQHVDSFGRPTFQPSTEPSIMSLLREDLYGVLGGVVNGTEQAVFRFTINPLVWWVWYGGVIVALGGLVVMWPGGGGSPAARRSQAGYAVRLVGEK